MFASYPQVKIAVEHTGVVINGSLPCTLRDTHRPLTGGTVKYVLHAHIFLCCISCMKGKNMTLGRCSFWFSTKIHGNISPSENNLLGGQWSLVTKILCLCPISKLLSAFPLHLLSALNQLLAWVLPQVLEWVYQIVWHEFVFASSPRPDTSLYSTWCPQVQCRAPSRPLMSVN